MKHKLVLPFLLLFLASGTFAFSQTDNEALPIKKEKVKIGASERFDLVFSRGVLLDLDTPDSSSMDPSRSGSFALAVGFSFNFGDQAKVAFRLQPRVNWHKMYFARNKNRLFPTAYDSTIQFEKHRVAYVELPIGIKFNLKRNFQQKVRLFLEFGAIGGYGIGGATKFRRESSFGGETTRETTKYPTVQNAERIRYGVYGQFGTNWLGVGVFYRLSDLYKQGSPAYSNLELVISIIL